jgi:hypothetical protein
MNVLATLEAHPQTAKPVRPGDGALHDPARVTPKPLPWGALRRASCGGGARPGDGRASHTPGRLGRAAGAGEDVRDARCAPGPMASTNEVKSASAASEMLSP